MKNVMMAVAMMMALATVMTGCKSSNGGDTTSVDTTPTDVPEVVDDSGDIVSGKNFADYCTPVEGVSYGPVYFGFDSAVLAPSEVAKVEDVARHLMDNASHVLVVDGHCDDRGSNEYNLSLGENRALGLRTYIINLGVDGERIQTRSFGEEKPAVTGVNEAARAKNRRGEFELFQR